MAAIDDLKRLLDGSEKDLPEWVIGYIPSHYKRLSISMTKAKELAKLGQKKIGAYYGDSLFFTQALIAGAMFSEEYDNIHIVTPSQYGKSWLMGRVAVIRAFEGAKQYVAATTADGTEIIMNNVQDAILHSAPEVQLAIEGINRNKLDRLATSLSKTRIAFPGRGFVEGITLGDSYNDNKRNKAVGRGGDYIVDEAAFVSDNAYVEMGRGELNKLDGESSQFVGISNPHQAGWFYDSLIEEEVSKRDLVIWMDARTALEEGRFTYDQIINSKYAKNPRTIKQYWLCELDTSGDGMFSTPKLYEGEIEGDYLQHFLGIDAAYKGKDNICVGLIIADDNGKLHVDEILTIKKPEWIDGVTSEDISNDIFRLSKELSVSKANCDIGWGVWLVEALKKKGVNISGINFAESPTRERVRAKHYSAVNASNKRAEMHLDLQNLIDSNMIDFSKEAFDKVKDIFPFVTYERRASGKIQIRPKSEIKTLLGRSPDELDCVLLGLHAAIQFGSENYEYIE